ncbi:hypothetical protein [Hominifimenecus sp. rT4P-3]|uniref:hypothetical protein n=1 Tax=Hominifimenecus sp. rT4P-3 TaxID=3242979 RepID=UPI003DA2A059
MLGKLWKYDCKATWLYLVLSYVILVGYTLILKLTGIDLEMPFHVAGVVGLMRIFLYIGFVIVAIAVQLFTYVQVIRRFYKNMFSHEGYLTNTLPVKPWELLVSKVLSGSFWMIATTLVLLFCLTILGTALPYEARGLLVGIFRDIWHNLPDSTIVLTAILLIVSPFQTILIYYACICVGQLFPKMRILAAVLIYLGYSLVEGVVGSLFSALLMDVMDPYGTVELVFATIYTFVTIAAGYFVCHWVLTRHLNLE